MIPVNYVELVNICNYHSKKYYIDSYPEISDEDYDSLYRKLTEYEAEHPNEILSYSPTQRVGSPVRSSDIVKRDKDVKMLSLDNAFTPEDLTNFTDKLINEEYAVELKLDGASLELEYIYGTLTEATTRGDGSVGEVVTHAAKAIKSIPVWIPELRTVHKLQIRGEVVMPYKAAEEYKQKHPEKETISPRNIASGSLGLLDPKEVATRQLLFIPHSLGYYPKDIFHSFKHFNVSLRQWGFRTITTKVLRSTDDIISLYNRFTDYRKKLPFAADGIVIKVNDFSRHSVYGETKKAPKWAIAWKFPSEEGEVILRQVVWQVGRTGVITPVAVFDPVELSGVMVENATLHNWEDIQRKDIMLNDTIVVTRSGDVIPKVLKSVTDKRTVYAEMVQPPGECPECGTPTEKTKAAILCRNPECRAQVIQRIVHFGSRDALDIKGLGESMAAFLYDELAVKTLKGIIDFDFAAYAETTTKKKTFNNLGVAIQKVMEDTSPSKLLYSFGIPHIGNVQAEEIINFLETKDFGLRDLVTSGKVQAGLGNIAGIGHVTANTFRKFMENKSFQEDILHVIDSVKCFKKPKTAESNTLNGFSFVITGTLSKPRGIIEDYIKLKGGKITSSVSKKTLYLVAGENYSQEKIAVAKKYNVQVITEDELYNLKTGALK